MTGKNTVVTFLIPSLILISYFRYKEAQLDLTFPPTAILSLSYTCTHVNTLKRPEYPYIWPNNSVSLAETFGVYQVSLHTLKLFFHLHVTKNKLGGTLDAAVRT